jgi:hypothetical protein
MQHAVCREIPGVEVTLKRVPETVSPEVAKRAGAKLDHAAPVASPKELGDYDAIPTILACQAGKDVDIEKPRSHTKNSLEFHLAEGMNKTPPKRLNRRRKAQPATRSIRQSAHGNGAAGPSRVIGPQHPQPSSESPDAWPKNSITVRPQETLDPTGARSRFSVTSLCPGSRVQSA